MLPEANQQAGKAPAQEQAGAGAGKDGDMLGIVQAQRNRFMGRINDLEREKDSLTRQVAEARQTGQHLQRDNLKLYEKIRYLQSYGGGGGGGGAGQTLGGVGPGGGGHFDETLCILLVGVRLRHRVTPLFPVRYPP